MTERQEYFGREAVEREAGYRPLREDSAPAPELTARDAATELADDRNTVPDLPVERVARDQDGEKLPDNVTLTPEQGARQLHSEREAERQAERDANDADLREQVDRLRAAEHGDTPDASPDRRQPQPERAPDQTPQTARTDGLDPEVVKAFENPKVKAAVLSMANQVEQAHRHYATATEQAADAAAAALLANFPELHGIQRDQLGLALNMLQRSNPQRHAEVNAALLRANAIYEQSIQAKAALHATEAKRFDEYAAEQDRIYDETVKLEPAQKAELKAALLSLADDVGIGRDELVKAMRESPLARHAGVQRLLTMAAQYKIAQDRARTATAVPKPPVQRPGVASAGPGMVNAGNVDRLRSRFERATGQDQIRLAAQLLAAERRG